MQVKDYIIGREIGRGNFGVVYKASLSSDKSQVFALKKIKKKDLEESKIFKKYFLEEIKIMERVKHQNIIDFKELVEEKENYFIVMEYCDGGDLESLLRTHDTFPEIIAVNFLKQLMNGFVALRKHKVIHRDLKLANLLIREGRLVISDFGLSKIGAEVTGTMVGTPLTMAPELLSRDYYYTSKADLWSIGVCFYRMLYGSYPFNGKNFKHLLEDIKSNSGKDMILPIDYSISSKSEDLIRALLTMKPDERIGWKDFFAHSLFEPSFEVIRGDSSLIESDMITEANLETNEKIDQEFNKNRDELSSHQINEISLIVEEDRPTKVIDESDSTPKEPLKLNTKGETFTPPPVINLTTDVSRENLKDKVQKKSSKELESNHSPQPQQKSLKEISHLVKGRLLQEKEKILFLIYSARKLRNAQKIQKFDEISEEKLILASLYCVEKAKDLNQTMVNSLEQKVNTYIIEGFNLFCDKDPDKSRVLQAIISNQENYTEFYRQLHQVYTNMKGSSKKKQERNSNHENLIELEKFRETLSPIFGSFRSKILSSYSLDSNIELIEAIARLGVSISFICSINQLEDINMWIKRLTQPVNLECLLMILKSIEV